MSNEYQTAYGIKDGEFIHIDDVERGLKCNCECIVCGGDLVANQGNQKAHYFAHHTKSGLDYCNESVVHKLSKLIIEKELQFDAPIICVTDDNHTNKTIELEKVVAEQNVFVEPLDGDSGRNYFRPDLSCTSLNKEDIFVEIVVTNGVSTTKIEKVKKSCTPMLSIDMSDVSAMDNLDVITKQVLHNAPRYWVYHPEIAEAKAEKVEELKREKLKLSPIVDEQHLGHSFVAEKPVQRKGWKVDDIFVYITSIRKKILLFGYKRECGYSREFLGHVDTFVLSVGEPIYILSDPSIAVRTSKGYSSVFLNVHKSLLPKLENMSFPCEVIAEFPRRKYHNGHNENRIHVEDFVTDIHLF